MSRVLTISLVLKMPSTFEVDAPASQTGFSITEFQAPTEQGQPQPPVSVSKTNFPVTTVFCNERSKSWVRTPEYRQKRLTGTLPMNLYYRKEMKRNFLNISLNSITPIGNNGWSRTSAQGQVAINYPGDTVFVSKAEMDNLIRAKARDAEFSAPVFAAEAVKTAEMVTHAARRLARVVRSLRRGEFGTAYGELNLPFDRSDVRAFERAYGKKPVDTAANAWMEGRYGWRPVLADARNGAEALAKFVQERSDSGDRTLSVSVKRTRESVSSPINASFYSIPYTYQVRTIDMNRVRAVWVVRPAIGWQPSWLGLDNPFEVAWEVLPFSFVYDWFLPIGDFISALSLNMPCSHKEYGIAILVQNQCVYEQASGSPASVSSAISTCEVRRFIPQGGPPTATLPFAGRVNLNWAKAADSLAMLRQQLVSLRRG